MADRERRGTKDVTHPGWGDGWSTTTVQGAAADEVHRISRERRRRDRRRRRTVRRCAVAATALVVAGALAGAVSVGLDALHARAELEAAATKVHELKDQVVEGDRAGATASLTNLQAHSSNALAYTRGLNWSVVAALPWIGQNVRAVQTVSGVIDDLATQALPALMDATALVDPATLAPVGGRIILDPMIEAAPGVISADRAVQVAAADLKRIDTKTLMAAIATQVDNLRAQVTEVAMTTATASRAVQLIPAMLGADGPREYLLLVQNNAEQRATGGVPILIRLRVEDGEVEVVETRSAGGNLGSLGAPILPLTPEEQSLFGEGLGRYMADVTFTPDFPRSGELARAIWRQQVGTDLDGVLSIDAGALAEVLGATGPVMLTSGQTLTSANAVEMLLNTVYLEIADPVEQDAFFAATATSVFDAVIGGRGTPVATVGALAKAAREGRLMVWSAHADERDLLSGTVLSGELVGMRGDSPVVGVYLNDGTAAKIGYYLRTDVAATSTECRHDGSQEVTVKVTLTSTAPANAAELPPYIASGTSVPKGEIRTNVLLYAPTGGQVDDVRLSNGELGVFSQTHNGLAVVGKTIQVKPGEKVAITYTIHTGPNQTGIPVLRVTPVALGESAVTVSTKCG